MKIKELGTDERPMEKLLTKGAATLSNCELLGLILRSGTKSINAMDLGRLLLSGSEDSLTRLSSLSVEKLIQTPGIGQMKAATIVAAFELGRRFMSERHGEKEAVTGPEQIFKVMIPLLKGLTHEEFWVVFLNRANYILGKEQLSSGGLSSTVIDNRMIVLRAMEKKASGLVIVHNHPSGNPKPGTADLKQTERLKKALEPLDLSLLDHIIICDDCYFSFADERIYSPA